MIFIKNKIYVVRAQGEQNPSGQKRRGYLNKLLVEIMPILTALPILISLASFWIAYRAYLNSKYAEEVASQYHALSVMSEWRCNIRKVEWEYLFVSRDIEGMLKINKNHPELLMWQEQIKKYETLPSRTLKHIEKLTDDLNKKKKSEETSKELSSKCNHGNNLVKSALDNLFYINKALDEFNADEPKFYRSN